MMNKTLNQIIKTALGGIALIAISAGAQGCVTCPTNQSYNILEGKCTPCKYENCKDCVSDNDCPIIGIYYCNEYGKCVKDRSNDWTLSREEKELLKNE